MPARMFGPYRLDALLGRGGMGEVWRAVDTGHDRVVALKLLLESLADDAEYRARFERESRIAAGLTEQHTIPIHRFGEIDGRLYIDMRYVEGSDLRTLLSRQGRLPAERAVGIIGQVASALDAAHRAALVHRDVKPANVLLAAAAPGDPDAVYLADFGIARALGPSTEAQLTGTGVTIGTADYMAPERFGGGPSDHRADVYALGCVLHECLTGAKPFPGDGFVALLLAHMDTPPPRPRDTVPDLPAALDDVVATALAKDPARRHASAGALAAAARQALEGTRPLTGTGPEPEQQPPSASAWTSPPRTAAPAGPPATSVTTRTPPPSWTATAAAVPPASPVTGRTPPSSSRTTEADDVPAAPPAPMRTPPPPSPTTAATATAATATPPPSHAESGQTATGSPAAPPGLPRTPGRPPAASSGPHPAGPARPPTLAAISPPAMSPPATGRRGRRMALLVVAAVLVAAATLVGVTTWTRSPVTGPASSTTATAPSAPTAAAAAPVEIGAPMQLVPGGGGVLSTVAVGQLGGRPVVVAAGGGADYAGRVAVFDLATGQPVGAPFGGPSKEISAVAVGELDGRPVLVGGSADTTLWVWDLVSGQPIGESFTGEIGSIWSVAFARLGDRPVLVSASGCDGCEPDNPSAIRVWDVATHALVGPAILLRDAGGVAVAQLDGRPVIVAGNRTDRIGVWDLADRRPLGAVAAPPAGSDVGAFAIGELDGRPVLVTGTQPSSPTAPVGGNTIQVWDLATRQAVGQPVTALGTGGVARLTIAQVGGRPVIVAAGVDNTIRLFDLRTRQPVGRAVPGTDTIVALAAAETEGRPVVVVGAEAGARVLDLTVIAG